MTTLVINRRQTKQRNYILMRIHKQPRLVFFLILSMMAATVVADHQKSQQAPSATTKEEATPIQEGVLTEKQKEHSKLYKQNYHSRRRLRDYPNGIEKSYPPPWDGDLKGSAPKSTEELLKTSACAADAVVVGSVSSKSSQFTQDGYSIFTDYEMIVEEIIKDNASAHIQQNSNISITRHGGVVEFNRKIFRVSDQSFEPFEIGGKYLLFLKFVPATGAYQALNSESSFGLKQNKVKKLPKYLTPYPFNYENDAVAFAARVRAAASNCGKAGNTK
jgi:hypothetical protein